MMLHNYLVTMVRVLKKSKLITMVNVLGLAIGLATSLLIALFVLHETSYNHWLPNYENIYKVEFTEVDPGREPLTSAKSPSLLAQALLKDYAEIESAVRLAPRAVTIEKEETQFSEILYLADASFFQIFELPLLAGNRDDALTSTNNIGISQRMSQKYFGDQSALGQTLTLNSKSDHVITAVFENQPSNSHFNIDFIALINPNKSAEFSIRDSWGSDSVHTYIKVAPSFNTDILSIDQQGFAERNITLNWTTLPPADLMFFSLIGIDAIHLYAKNSNHELPVSEISVVVTFAIVAGMILMLAIINFTNLSIAQAQKRAREVSLRKVLGAKRPQLIRQFLSEAVFTSFVAFILAMVLVELSLPFYNEFLGLTLSLNILTDPLFALTGLSLVVLTGILGGLYPAILLSGFRPSKILRSNRSGNHGSPWFRNVLIALQFSISISLIASASIVYMQTEFARSLDLGFTPKGKISIAIDQNTAQVTKVLKRELEHIDGVISVAGTSSYLPMVDAPLVSIKSAATNSSNALSMKAVFSDANFFNFLSIEPLAGRLFHEDRSADLRTEPMDKTLPITRSAVLNEAAVAALGLEKPSSAVGQTVRQPGANRETLISIIGVVPDLHLDSLYSEIEPLIFFYSDATPRYLMIDIGTLTPSTVLANIAVAWENIIPGAAMNPVFLETAYDALYQDSVRQGQLFFAFAAFAVFVASFGLYGLTAQLTERRTKEIGVRKVFGASIMNIVNLLTFQFSKPVMAAAPIGIAASLIAMNEWLQSFAYRISLSANFWIFLVAAALALIVAWLSTSSHTIAVARRNPVDALKYE